LVLSGSGNPVGIFIVVGNIPYDTREDQLDVVLCFVAT